QGLLSYLDETGAEVFVAVDEGVLVKAGGDVRVACRRAVVAGDLANAKRALTAHLELQSDNDRRARAALRSLEAEVLRRMGDLSRAATIGSRPSGAAKSGSSAGGVTADRTSPGGSVPGASSAGL